MGFREKNVLRPRLGLTLVGRLLVSSQSVRVLSEGLGLLETPKQANIQAIGQLRKSPSYVRGPRGLVWLRLISGLISNLGEPEPIGSERCNNREALRSQGG